MAESVRLVQGQLGALDSFPYSFRRSFRWVGIAPHHCNEKVGDAGPTHVAESSCLISIDILEEHHAPAENGAFMDGFERARGFELIWFEP